MCIDVLVAVLVLIMCIDVFKDKGKKSVADDDVESFSDWWVVEHASQV